MIARDLKRGDKYRVPGWDDHPKMRTWIFKHLRIDKAGNVWGEMDGMVMPVIDPDTEVELVEGQTILEL